MNEERSVKEQKNSKVVYILLGMLIVIIVCLVGFIISDKMLDDTSDNINNSSVVNNQNLNENLISNSVVPAEDTYALDITIDYQGNAEVNYYLLNNGKLYYKILSNIDDYYHTYDFTYTKNGNKDLIEFTGLTNIKRIKGANTISTGVDFNVLLITADGKVYTYVAGSQEAKLNTYLKDYVIDDIYEYTSVNGCISDGSDNFVTCGGTYKFLTTDGKTHNVTLNTDGTITEK